MTTVRKRLVWAAAVVFPAVACLVVGFIELDRHLDPFDDQPFDPATWAAASEQERGPMARAAARHLPPGTPAATVRELLGEPTSVVTGYHVDPSGWHPNRHARWSYWLGCWSGLSWYGFDSADLDVYLDCDGRVTATEVTGG